MSNATKYIESVSITDEKYGDILETVSVSEAFIACKFEKLDTLVNIRKEFDNTAMHPASISVILDAEIEKINKQLRNIKLK